MEPVGLSDLDKLQISFGGNAPTTGTTAWNETHSKLFVPYDVPFDINKYGVAVVMPPGQPRDNFVAAVRRHAISTNVTHPDSSHFQPLNVYTYDTTDAFETYYSSKGYGVDGPKIYGAWYINGGSATDPHWDYTVRLPVGGPFQDVTRIYTGCHK